MRVVRRLCFLLLILPVLLRGASPAISGGERDKKIDALIRQSPEKLDLDRYEKLANPSVGYHPVTYFSSVKPDLFEYILRKFDPTWGKNPDPMSRGSVSPHARTDVAEAN